MSSSGGVTGGQDTTVHATSEVYDTTRDDRTPEEFMESVFVVVPMLEAGEDGVEPTAEEQQEHLDAYAEETGDYRVALTQEQYDATLTDLQEVTDADGMINISDGDIEARLRNLFNEQANVSLNLVNVYATEMEASLEKTDAFTKAAESAMQAANTVDNGDDTVDLDPAFDYEGAAAVYVDAGDTVPDWIQSQLSGDGSVQASKTDLEALSSMYTNAATAEQSDGQMIMNKLQTAQNRYDEAVRAQTSLESDRHDLAKLINQS